MKTVSVSCLLILVAFGVGNASQAFAADALMISKETTQITEPLTADGKRVDYFRAMEQKLYPEEMKTDENGYRILVRALGDHRNDRLDREDDEENDPALQKQTYEKLGLDFSLKPNLSYKAPDTFFLPHPTKKNTMLSYGPWDHAPRPDHEKWLNANTAALDILVQAVQKPTFCVPLVRTDETQSLYELTSETDSFFREISHGLRIRTFHRIQQEDGDGAMDDLIAAYRLARFVTHQPRYHDLTWGIALENCAHQLPLRFASLEQLQRFNKAWDKLPARKTIPQTRELERWFVLDAVCAASQCKDPALRAKILRVDADFDIDWNTVLRKINDNYDRFIATMNSPQWYDEETLDKIADRGEKSERLADMVFCRMVMQDMTYPEVEIYCRQNLRKIALALLIYEREKGKLPDGNWQDEITPLLGEYAKYYFRNPWHQWNEEKTSYALVRYESEEKANANNALMLVLLKEPMPRNTIINSEKIKKHCVGEVFSHFDVAYRDGSVDFFAFPDEENR